LPALALLAVLAGAAAAPVLAPEVRLEPDRAVMGAPFETQGQAASLDSKGLLIRVEPLDEARRDTYFKLRSALGRDPLPRRDRAPKGYTVFEVSLHNHSGMQASFAPALAQCWLNKDRELRRLDADHVLDLLRVIHSSHPFPEQAAVDGLEAFHLTSVVLDNGQSVSRLLVFRDQPTRTPKVSLDLEAQVGGEEIRAHFQYLIDEAPR
jgi:hypothetical protein